MSELVEVNRYKSVYLIIISNVILRNTGQCSPYTAGKEIPPILLSSLNGKAFIFFRFLCSQPNKRLPRKHGGARTCKMPATSSLLKRVAGKSTVHANFENPLRC